MKLKTPIIHVDPKAGAVYVVVAKGEIDKQTPILQGLTKSEKMFFIGDFDKEGQYIGFEIFGRVRGPQRQKRRYGPGVSPFDKIVQLKADNKALQEKLRTVSDAAWKVLGELGQIVQHSPSIESLEKHVREFRHHDAYGTYSRPV